MPSISWNRASSSARSPSPSTDRRVVPDWPYPFWIAHRGGGSLAPENTLAAFHRGHEAGWRMFECDVQLSADGVPFLLHDLTLERTTGGRGFAHEKSWDELARLDAGSWYGARYAGERPATLVEVADFCLQRSCPVNLEIKPPPSGGTRVGGLVASHAARLWHGAARPPLVSSFDLDALRAARRVAPDLPRALVLADLHPGWQRQCVELACVAVVGEHPLWNRRAVSQAQSMGLRVLSYTVNTAREARRLLALGTQGVIGDFWLQPQIGLAVGSCPHH